MHVEMTIHIKIDSEIKTKSFYPLFPIYFSFVHKLLISHYMPHKKSKLLNRISRIFNHKEDIVSQSKQNLTFTKKEALVASLYSNNSSMPVLLQRAPSSKLLIEDDLLNSMCSTLGHSSSCSDYYEINKHQNRQSWFTTISKLKTSKTSNKNKRNSNGSWYIAEQQQQQQQRIEIPDQQQKEQGVMIVDEEEVKRLQVGSPLSIASSINSTKRNNKHHLTSSSSFWLPIEQGNTSTARTSIDSQRPKNLTTAEQPESKCIMLAENVKNILGDAIFLADIELDI